MDRTSTVLSSVREMWQDAVVQWTSDRPAAVSPRAQENKGDNRARAHSSVRRETRGRERREREHNPSEDNLSIAQWEQLACLKHARACSPKSDSDCLARSTEHNSQSQHTNRTASPDQPGTWAHAPSCSQGWRDGRGRRELRSSTPSPLWSMRFRAHASKSIAQGPAWPQGQHRVAPLAPYTEIVLRVLQRKERAGLRSEKLERGGTGGVRMKWRRGKRKTTEVIEWSMSQRGEKLE